MEKTDHGVVIPLDAGWNDIGASDALATVGQVDSDGNARRGDVRSIDSQQLRAVLGR
jgi:mannose-1-phosphate guanylyltransferase